MSKTVKAILAMVTAVIMAGTTTVSAQAALITRGSSNTNTATTAESRPKKVEKATDWEDERGRIFMPFTGEYVSKKYFNGLIKRVKSGVDIVLLTDHPLNAGGSLVLCNLDMVAVGIDDKIINLHITNIGPEDWDMEGTRLYIRQSGAKLQCFVTTANDEDFDDIAYCEAKIGKDKKIARANMKTKRRGSERLNKHALLGASGTMIGADQSGIIKAGESVKVTLTLK